MRRRAFPARTPKNYAWHAQEAQSFLPHGSVVPFTVWDGPGITTALQARESFLLQRVIIDLVYRLGDETLERTSPQLAIQSLGHALIIIDTDDSTVYDPNAQALINFEKLLNFGHTAPYGIGTYAVLGTVQDATGGFPYGGHIRLDVKTNRRVTNDELLMFYVGIDASIGIDVDDDTCQLSYFARTLYRKM